MKAFAGRLAQYIALLILAALVLIAALTLLGPMIGNMFMFGWNWVAPGYIADGSQELAWASDQAISPDGTRIVAIEPNAPDAPRRDMCPTRLRVRDADSQRVLAEMACQDFIYTWRADRVAWVDSGTIALDSPDGQLFLWKWRAFLFPFGRVWLMVEGFAALLATLILANRMQRAKPASMQRPVAQ